jgi:hypothetical protein
MNLSLQRPRGSALGLAVVGWLTFVAGVSLARADDASPKAVEL